MRKLLKYEFLNSYKFIAIEVMAIFIIYIIQYYLNITKVNSQQLSSILVIAGYGGFIAYCIASINDSVNNREGLLIHCVPEKKEKVFLSKILIITMYTVILVLFVSLLNIIIGYIPFVSSSIGLNYSKNGLEQLKLIHKILLYVFYTLWSFSYILALIVTGIFVSIISNAYIKKLRFSYITTSAIYILVFFGFSILMLKSMNVISLNYNESFISDNLLERGGYSFMTMDNASVFRTEYDSEGLKSISMSFGIIIFNFIWFTLIGTICGFLFNKKVEV